MRVLGGLYFSSASLLPFDPPAFSGVGARAGDAGAVVGADDGAGRVPRRALWVALLERAARICWCRLRGSGAGAGSSSLLGRSSIAMLRSVSGAGEGVKMQLVGQGNGGPEDLPQLMRYWVEEEQCIPGFLASITLECYDRRKREQELQQ